SSPANRAIDPSFGAIFLWHSPTIVYPGVVGRSVPRSTLCTSERARYPERRYKLGILLEEAAAIEWRRDWLRAAAERIRDRRPTGGEARATTWSSASRPS